MKVIVFLKQQNNGLSITFNNVSGISYKDKCMIISHSDSKISTWIPYEDIFMIEQHEEEALKVVEIEKQKDETAKGFWRPLEDPNDRIIVAPYVVFPPTATWTTWTSCGSSTPEIKKDDEENKDKE